MVRCPQCGSERFILPRNPFAGTAERPTQGRPVPRFTGTAALWWLPLLAATVTAATLALVYWIFLVPKTAGVPTEESAGKKTPADRLRQAGRYLADGLFRLATDELQGEPGDLSGDDKRHWRQLQREAALLADLSSEPLEAILQHAAGVPEREWQAEFPRRYRGKAILFDTIVRQTVNGKLQGTYFFPAPEKIRLEIGNLELLRRLPLDQPRRVLFGARLAGIRLAPPGPAWRVEFEPGSGVLLTDARAAGLCCPALNEPEALRLLEEQAGWLATGSQESGARPVIRGHP